MKLRSGLVWFVSLIVLTGCAAKHPISFPVGGQLPPGETLVIGRITRTVNGKPEPWGNGSRIVGCTLDVQNVQVGQSHEHLVRGDGRFCWHLRPGSYHIGTINWGFVAESQTDIRFRVPAKSKIVYIGTLHLQTRAGNPWFSMQVRDEYADAVADFDEKYPGMQEVVDRQLMQLHRVIINLP